jgi:N-acetylmuramoyl-L-alanine amidase CwlA
MQIKQDLLTINPFSRPGYKLKTVKKIVIHYVQNPETTAKQNRNFFEMRKEGNHGYGSSQYICDDTEILQCIPDDEMAYCVGAKEYTEFGLSISNYPNDSTIHIEFCHPDLTGRPCVKTYTNILDLSEHLCKKFNLDPVEDICRHFDITGKDCPKYYVAVQSEWYRLKADVLCRLNN